MRKQIGQTRSLHRKRLVLLFVGVALCALVAAGCSSSSVAPPGPTGPHLYAAEPNANQIAVLSLPLTMTSLPAFNISGLNFDSGIAFDSMKNLYVSNTDNMAGSVAVFNPPYSANSAPAFTISGVPSKIITPEQIGFDGSGNLWVADQINKVLEFSPPFGAASTPALMVTTSINSAQGVAFDSAANLYVADNNGELDVFAPPYAAAPVQTAMGLQFPLAVATDHTNVYVADFGIKGIVVYTQPVAAAAAPAFTMTNGLANGPHGLTFDAGNMYVSTNAGEIVIFTPPFSSTSMPLLTVSCFASPASNCLTRQLAFGP